MNEHDLTRHLSSYADNVSSSGDRDRLHTAMVRVDRNRRIRAMGAAGSMVAVVAFGIITFGGNGESATHLDVRAEGPAPTPEEPELAPGTVEEPAPAAEEPSTGPVDPDHPVPPAHLQASTTTTIPAVAEVSTTLPPTTVPATTTPPVTAPSTTIPPPTTAPTDFSAWARYGSCEEDPPYDEYSGTATAGATITITSPYSAPAQTAADGSGDWFLRVEFPTAPVGTPFTVTASDGTGTVEMGFVHVG